MPIFPSRRRGLIPRQCLLLVGVGTVLLYVVSPFASHAHPASPPPAPAILFHTDGSELQWLVLDVPVVDDTYFFGGAVLQLTTPAGIQLDTLVDEALVAHNPQRARPDFSQQLYFLRNRYPAAIEAALRQGRGITVELRQPGTTLVRRYRQDNRTLLVNPRPVLLNRGSSISSATARAGSKP